MLSPTWDLIVHPPLGGELNMAVDNWLFNNHPRPAFRLYGWQEPTISIGYRQKFRPPQRLKKLAERFPTVVRPTGGGYLLHTGDITFSIFFPKTHKFAQKPILEFYAIVRDSFTRTARQLNLISGSKRGRGNSFAADCLATPGRHEPVEGDRKWLATAQVKRRGATLQHGSIFWEEKSWPDNFKHTPYFLGTDNHVNRESFVNRLIKNISVDIFKGRFCNFYRLAPGEWQEITESKKEFSTEDFV
ncbi:MAG: lipoyl protein ligase domain-containing protein [bacterium]